MTKHAQAPASAFRRGYWAGMPWRDAARDALVPFVAWRLVLFGVVAFVNSYIVPNQSSTPAASGPSMLWAPWNRFDSTFYIGIADRGYSANSGPDWAFYPLYPSMVRVAGLPFGGGHTTHLILGLVVANLAAVGAAFALYLLVRREWGRDVARRASLYFAVFPLSFYLSAPYAESLFVLLAVSALLLTRQHRWLAAGVVAALAAATRPPGVMLAVVLFTELVCVIVADRRTNERTALLRPLVGIALVPTGLLAFLAFGKHITGDWLVTFHVNADTWKRRIDFPWKALGDAIEHAEWGNPANYLFQPLNLALVAVYAIALALMIGRFAPTFTVFTAALLVLSVSAGTLQAMGRQVLPIVTVLILLAVATRSETSNRHQAVMTAFAGLCTIFLAAYVLLIPAIA